MTPVPSSCPCGSGRPYAACCRPFHDGTTDPPTAVQLMRARYSAFALSKTDYLLDTWHPSTRPRSLALDPTIRWTGLEILTSTGGSLLEKSGTVEFRARYRRGPHGGAQTERSRFVRVGSRWRYVGPIRVASQ